jgi:inner membrane protein
MVDPTLVLGPILIVAGIILLVVEIAHPGVFLLIPSCVLIAAGILAVFFPSILESWYGAAVILLVALGAGLLTIPYYKRIAPVGPPETTIPTSITGETGLVISPVIPDSLKGKVRVRSEIWSARSKVPIPAGTHVKVVGGEGVTVWVEPIDSIGS